jgi:NADPH2:quinone reductase
MKSMAIEQFGDNVFTEVTLPNPVAIAGHVVVKVAATSVNPIDYKLRKGFFPMWVKPFPVVLHGDMSGTIVEIGESVTGFAVGDEVYGCVGGLSNIDGALAEYVLADAQLIAHKPQSLSLTAAAAVPLVAEAAWEALVTYANVQQGQTVLIHGATGGVGHIAVQLAKWLGAKVFATSSSAEKMQIASQLGADVTINYKSTAVQSYVTQHTQDAGFDVVFDTVGGPTLTGPTHEKNSLFLA